MSGSSRSVPEEDLQAYVDNLLDPDRRAVVARFLQENPDIAARIAAYGTQRAELRAALASFAQAPIPPRLDPQTLLRFSATKRRAAWRLAASVVLALSVGGVGGWVLRGASLPPPSDVTELVREAVANHNVFTADRRRPTELGANERDDLARWVSNRLKFSVAPPDLSSLGFHYMGGRLAATSAGPAGMFMYQNDQAVRLTIFIRPFGSAPSLPMQAIRAGKLDGVAWIIKDVGYTVVAPLPADEIKRVAAQVQRQLEAAI